jgi:RNA polymerase primary sigma factor
MTPHVQSPATPALPARPISERRTARARAPRTERARLYLGDLERRPLLTREAEIELARRADEGDRAVRAAVLASPAARRELGEDAGELGSGPLDRRVLDRLVGALAGSRDQAAQSTLAAVTAGRAAAERARSELVLANLRLVLSFATRMLGRGLLLHDLVQEGNLGLMRAAEKFDHRLGHRFSTYASWWVKQQMSRAIADQAKTIRLPVHLDESRKKVRQVRSTFAQEHGREPTESELQERSGLAVERLQTIDRLAPEPLSLQAKVGPDHDAELGDFTPDRSAPAADEALADARMRQATRALLDGLTPREQDILRKRFGLDETREHTLAEIGESMSLSRERIRQIEATALRKLRTASEEGDLGTYLEH